MIAFIYDVGIFNFIIGIVGIIVGIGALVFAIYSHMQMKKSRKLIYKINPVRTQIVRSGAASRLSSLHDGREIKSDITAVHIAIWNQGRELIRQEHMLRPLTIYTEGHAPILEAKIHKPTHDVIGLRLDESKCAMGQLGVFWDILEKGDGGIVQIIYAGPPELKITVDAVPEGQRHIIGINFDGIIPPIPEGEKILRYMTLIAILMGANLGVDIFKGVAEVLQIGPLLGSSRLPLADKYPVVGWQRWSILLSAVVLVAGTTILFRTLWRQRQLKPPFEF